jgi:hypothetical protein
MRVSSGGLNVTGGACFAKRLACHTAQSTAERPHAPDDSKQRGSAAGGTGCWEVPAMLRLDDWQATSAPCVLS